MIFVKDIFFFFFLSDKRVSLFLNKLKSLFFN